MSHYKIGCDAHRRFSQFAVLDADGQFLQQIRVNHTPGAIRDFLEDYPPGTPVALESVGNWYCLHLWCGTGGSSTRSKPPDASRSWPTPPKPRS